MKISECIARLTGGNMKDACAYAGEIVAESRESDQWARYLTDFSGLLRHKNSFVRNRAIAIVAANARWADEETFGAVMEEFLRHVTDEKPITARQCIRALPEIAVAQPNLVPHLRRALERADLTGYGDSMQPLLLRDIAAVQKRLS